MKMLNYIFIYMDFNELKNNTFTGDLSWYL